MKPTKSNIKNQIYKSVGFLTSHIYSDDDWSSVNLVFSEIKRVLAQFGCSLTLEVSVKDGGYRSTSDGASKWKEYELSIFNEDKETLRGCLTCSAAGTCEDPFKCYDMALVLW